jgi:hypothetical protein
MDDTKRQPNLKMSVSNAYTAYSNVVSYNVGNYDLQIQSYDSYTVWEDTLN